MFERQASPRVFGVDPGDDYPATLARGVLARLSGSPPEALARVEIIVNTERMRRRLAELFARLRPGLQPRVTPVAHLATRFPMPGVLPQRPPLRRKLDLARLVGALIDANPELAPRASVHALADGLAALFDEIQGEGVDPESVLSLDVDDMSGHWARSLAFLRIARDYVEACDDGAADAELRNRETVTKLAERWSAAPPETPIIVAGSTGSRGTTALLMDAVARLPQGALVLPGFDFSLPPHVWAELGPDSEDHPQARFARLLDGLDLAPSEVARWADVGGDQQRNALISLALRPAPVTDQWLSDGPALGALEPVTASLALIEAPSPRIEAQAIALRLRQAAEEGQTAALVTPDRTLTRQVTAALRRWGIEPDDSAGRPLALSAPGRLLRHVADLFGRRLTAQALIVLLKHPLTATGGGDRGPHLRLSRELELHLRKRWIGFPEVADLAEWAGHRDEAVRVWADWVARCVGGLDTLEDLPLEDFLTRLVTVSEHLAAGPGGSGTGELWLKDAGEKARDAIGQLVDAAPGSGVFAAYDCRSLLESVLNASDVRDPVSPHPGVMIWGTLEARVQGADLVILGGLNDGVWPEHPAPDPWLNRAMRRQAGLLLPERRIGLSAHDFQQAIAAREVVLSRARRDAEAETVPSRWLNRLTNLLSGLPAQGGTAALDAMRTRGERYIEAALALERRAPRVAAAGRPSPRPPLAARPSHLSVTEIERLLRDPYAVYGRRVLGLRPLDALARTPDPALRGTVLHKVAERMLAEGLDPAASDAADRLIAIVDEVLDTKVPWPATRRLWRGRMLAVIPRLLSGEMQRRSEGCPLLPERKGRLVFDGPDFTLTGTADRIDVLNDGTLAIYDYKSATIPTEKQVRFFNRQLGLEAVIAEAGGFEGVSAGTVTKLGYIALGPSARDRTFPADGENSPQVVAEEFRRLVTAFFDHSRGYTSRRSVPNITFSGDFDHLARFGEWDDSDDPGPEVVG